MDLLILCAGTAEKDWAGAKPDRPLRTKGKRQAQKIGAWLGREGLRPGIVLTACGRRARVTAEKALKAAGWTAKNIRPAEELAAGVLPDLGTSRRALLVASPGAVRALAGRLGLKVDAGPGVLIRLACGPDGTRLTGRVDPGRLPDLFPYPAPDGGGRRERPAYYYTQSAVIPYRQTVDGPQILIIGSSSGRHWSVPKGIVEPGLGPAASAKVEAREEAGVEGKVGRTPLGRYTYAKWGATCEVTVFAMQVTKVLEGEAWEESHRKRRWVSPEAAAGLLQQEALGELTAALGDSLVSP